MLYDNRRYEFGVRLRTRMKECDVNENLLAEWMDVSIYTVRKWMYEGGSVDKGYYYPTVNKLMRLCEILQVSADWLLFGKGNEND